MPFEELVSDDHLGPVMSTFLMDGVGTLGFLVLVGLTITARIKKLRQARMADASFDPAKQLTLGETIVCGRVEVAEGSAKALRIDVDQLGEESESSGVWSHKWTETSRRIDVQPFYLRLDSGERV